MTETRRRGAGVEHCIEARTRALPLPNASFSFSPQPRGVSQWELGGRRGGVDFVLASEWRRGRHDGLSRRRIAPYRREICRWAAVRGTLVLVLCPTAVCSKAGEGYHRFGG